jgi:hypothetical protein
MGAPPPLDAAALHEPRREPIFFEKQPGWGVSLGARGGLGGLARSEARNFFGYGGGFLRARYRHYEIGGFFDKSDDSDVGGGFTHAGGFLGAWLPYHNWVDFELALAFGSRTYTDSDSRYGAGGYSIGMPALSFIAGVSDLARSGKVGGRFGAQFSVTGDFKQQDRPWTFIEHDATGESFATNGTTHVGGVSVQVAVTIALEVGEGP